jgi:hypothetical protein
MDLHHLHQFHACEELNPIIQTLPNERVQIPTVHRDRVAFAILSVYVRVHHLTFLADDSHLDLGHHVCLAFNTIKLFALGLFLSVKAEQQTVDNRCFFVLYQGRIVLPGREKRS